MPLSKREVDIAVLVAQGLSNPQIAAHLGISELTVHAHIGRMLKALAMRNRTQIAIYALKTGLVRLEDIELPCEATQSEVTHD